MQYTDLFESKKKKFQVYIKSTEDLKNESIECFLSPIPKTILTLKNKDRKIIKLI